VIHRLELYPCFSFSADRGSETTTTVAAPARYGSWDIWPYENKDKDNRVGRPKNERRLFKPSQCQRRRRARVHTPPPPARSSRRDTSNRDRYPDTFTSIHRPVRVRLAAPGFHAESRPSSRTPPATFGSCQ